MKTFEIIKYRKRHPLSISIGHYSTGSIGIKAFTHENGYPEPWGNITVNLSEFNVTTAPFYSFIDIESNGEEIVDILVKNNFGELTGKEIVIGNYTFPEFKFNKDTLREYDEENFEEYEAYAEALEFLKK